MSSETPQEAFARVERALDERIPGRDEVLAMRPDVSRITALVDLLGQPQKSYPAIHLTGTNGKTSTTRMVDALLRAFGLRPGRYTSPHLATVRERIAIDGVPLDEEAFARAYDDIAPYLALVDERSPLRVTYFETLTAMAYAAFADAPVDVAVVEVGMGGQWDATNVIEAGTCVVTPVSLDHPELGSTVTQVATEKAGIVHAGARVISGIQELAVAEVLLERAATVGAEIAAEGVHFGVAERRVALGGQVVTFQGLGGVYEEVFLPLHGAYQASNAACALAAVESFLGGGTRALDVEAVRTGFAVSESPGRLEVVRRSPTVLLDGAHNPGGVRALVGALEEAFAFERLVGVVAILSDKDAHAMLAMLEPVLSDIVVTTNHSPRALSPDALAAVAVDVFGPDRVAVEPLLPNAIDAAVALADEAGEGSGVLVTGSLYTVGEARTLLLG